MRKVYLSNVAREEALERFLSGIELTRLVEKVSVSDAVLGRVTAETVFATTSMPDYHASAMDGFAVRADHTFGASDQNPLRLEPETFQEVDTGEPLPEGFDAVIKVEDVHLLPDGALEIIAPATPWQHVRAVGEDIVAGELIVSALHKLRPPDLGALLAGGVTEIELLARPRVAIIPTGSEVIPAGEPRERGSVPEFNSTVIAAYLREWGADPVIYPIVPDHFEQLKEAAVRAAEMNDLVIINAGSSAGREDHTARLIEELGEIFLHGVATRPGKPTILGKIGEKAAVGLPGYPVSAYLSLDWFVRPLVFRYQGLAESEPEKINATLGRRVVSQMGVEEHVRMTIGDVGSRFIANPLSRGAGVTMSLVRADGLLIIPEDSLGLEEGESVEIQLYRPGSELRYNLLAAGSHDLILDLLAGRLKELDNRLSLASSHLGSMGGIAAIGKGRAHFAGVHLFDPATGEYNVPYVRKHLSGQNLRLVNLVYRMQGWIVPAGNPDGVEGVETLATSGLGFVNRQKGAGTRLLFDHLLKQAGLSPADIYGYEREEHTHLNVAASVAAGTATVGLGILPAARAFDLDFVPVAEERYDLLMSEEFYCSPEGQTVLEVINDSSFREQVESMGGYSMREAGKLIDI